MADLHDEIAYWKQYSGWTGRTTSRSRLARKAEAERAEAKRAALIEALRAIFTDKLGERDGVQ